MSNSHINQPRAYGGQAVIEGVMIRGIDSMAVAVRRPDSTIAVRSEHLSRLYRGPWRRIPLVRGVLTLWETLALGMGALTWSSAVANDNVDQDGQASPLGLSGLAALVLSLCFALTVFFAGPVLLTAWLDRVMPAGWLVIATEGALRVGLLVGYVWAIGRSDDIRRVFQYHGAEHMTIHAYEHGAFRSGHVQVAAVRRFEKAHPRCGTSFLLTVALVAVVVFMLLGTPPLWLRVLSRIALIPAIAAVAFEAIRFAGQHAEVPMVRWLFAGNLALQRLTTRDPDDEQVQVAIAALERVLAEDRRLAEEASPARTELAPSPLLGQTD